MEVYMLESDPDEWAGLYTAHGEAHRFEPFDGSPKAAGWEPVEVAWAELEGRRGRADFCSVGIAPTFTGRAVEALGDLLEGRGELLPLEVVGGGEAYASTSPASATRSSATAPSTTTTGAAGS